MPLNNAPDYSWRAGLRRLLRDGGGLVLITGLVFAVLVGASVQFHLMAARYDRAGVVTVAEIVARRIAPDADGGDDYYLTFRFDAGDVVVERERAVSQVFYAAAGQMQEIRYLSDAPRRFETELGQGRRLARRSLVHVALGGLLMLAAGWYVRKRRRRTH